MTARWLPADEPFFREWRSRAPGERRSLPRSRLLADALGLDLGALPPALVVVGSKGKGTAVACASAVLAAYGLRVGSVTSPPFRTNAERIRIDGAALAEPAYDALAARVAEAIAALQARDDGYLAPTGVYTIAGLTALVGAQVDVVVVEEGLGGRSDEVSLVPPDVVAVTPVFAEHVGVIGSTVAEIAEDLLGVVRPTTRAVVSAPQREEVAALVHRAAGARLRAVDASVLGEVAATFEELTAVNAAVGATAGTLLAGHDLAEVAKTAPSLRRVRLPGRASLHRPAGDRSGSWLVDAAIDPVGVDAALAACRARIGEPALVLAAFPDVKDARACFARLRGLPVVPVKAGEVYLSYDESAAPSPYVDLATAFAKADEAGDVLCVGTISFVGEVLDHLGVDTWHWW